VLSEATEGELLEEGVSRTLVEGDDVAILALGSMVAPSLEAARLLREKGIAARVVDLRWAKPLDRKTIVAAAKTKLVVCVEEGVLAGGIGEAMLGVLADESLCVPVLRLGIPDTFVTQGTRKELLHELGLDGAGIAASVTKRLASLS